MIILSPPLPPAERELAAEQSKARAEHGRQRILAALLPFCPGAAIGAIGGAAIRAILESKTDDESNKDKDTNPKPNIPEHEYKKWADRHLWA